MKALWQKKDITLTINPTGGTWGGSSAKTTITQNFGTSATIEDPVRAGYSFLGWIPTQNKNTDSGSGYTTDTWAQVFHHNNANGSVLFSSSNNLASTTINEANKFSLLNKLDVIKTSSSGWEFLLEYPDQSSGRYNRWVQSSNPATTAEGNATQSTGIQAEAPDYVPKHIDWDENHWGGLGLSTSGSTFIDGSYGHGDWFYAIGSYASDGIGIPSYSSTGGVSQLWVKLPSSDVNALGITTSFKDADALGNNNTFWFNDCNITLQAVWKVNDYTVTADAQGGEIPATTGWTLGTGSTTATKLITYNTSYGTLPTPKKSGFKFEGWSLTSELPELEEGELPQYLTDTSIMTTAANHTIYAIYSDATFEITLDDGEGNTQTVMVTCDETEDITSTTTPTKTGYTFNGYENSEGTRVVDENKNFIPDIDGWTNPDGTWARYESCTLTALWKPIDYTVTLKVDTGDSTKDITVKVTYGTSNFEPAVTAVSRTGYEFLGWYKGISSTSELIINKDCVLQETSPYTEDGKWNYPGNVILNAVWKPETYTITLDNTTNGGTGGTTSVSATYESTFEFPGIQCPTKTGYEFEGWFTAETGGLKVIGTDGKLQESVSGYTYSSKWIYAGETTLYAQFTPIPYTLTYNMDGGTLGGSTNNQTVSFDIEDPLTAKAGPTKAGYTFQNWKVTAADAEGNWTQDTYNANESIGKGMYGDATLTAQWSANTITITLDNEDVTTAGSSAVYYKYNTNKYYSNQGATTEISEINLPAKTGYTFGGYYSGTSGSGEQYITDAGAFTNNLYSAFTDNTTLFAKWTAKEYTVTFNANGENATVNPTSRTVTYDDTYGTFGTLPTP
ncbi:MAG: InlB B-repeat-containing protein, partial [Clostridia bacterium]|nr:InlB B-repeat-containing protein [Clostridia bacterium]